MRPGDPNIDRLERMATKLEAVSGFLPGDAISQTRAPRILQRIAALAGQKT